MDKQIINKILWGACISVFIFVGLWGVWKLLDAQAESQAKPVEIPRDTKDYTLGNPKSKVILTEFSDYQCPACAGYNPAVKDAVDQYKDKIIFVYKHFPLSIHKNSKKSAYAAESAGKQKKFFEMSDKLFATQEEWGTLDDPQPYFLKLAKELKLDIEKFKNDYTDKGIAGKVESDLNLGTTLGVDSTPTFYINGKKIKPSASADSFTRIFDEELANLK